MKTLIATSIVTGVLELLLLIYMVWFEPSTSIVKIFITLGILFIGQVIAYLVMRDVQEESSGKDNGTIAN